MRTRRERIFDLKARYARVFEVELSTITVTELPDDDALVQSPGLPVWSLGITETVPLRK